MDQPIKNDDSRVKPALNLRFLSHGTLDVKIIANSRKFYEEFLGLECMQTSDISLIFRLGGYHVYAAVESGAKTSKMPFLYHNGLDVESDAEVDKCHGIVVAETEKWGLHGVTRPRVQHGTYSFYFWDMDDNCWEILTNPDQGYMWLFDKGDLSGRGHLDQSFDRPKGG